VEEIFTKVLNWFPKRRKTFPRILIDTFDGAKLRFLNRGKKRRSVSTLSLSALLGALSLSKGIPRALVLSAVEGLDRGSNGLISRWILPF